VVTKIAIYHRSEPRSLITNRLMHSLSEFGFDLMELFRKSHPHRCSLYHELSTPADTTVMRESQKVESLRLALSVYALAVLRRKAPKSDKTRFLRMEFQRVCPEPLAKFLEESLRFVLVLKSQHKVVSPAHYDYISSGFRLPPSLHPYIQHIMQVDICQLW